MTTEAQVCPRLVVVRGWYKCLMRLSIWQTTGQWLHRRTSASPGLQPHSMAVQPFLTTKYSLNRQQIFGNHWLSITWLLLTLRRQVFLRAKPTTSKCLPETQLDSVSPLLFQFYVPRSQTCLGLPLLKLAVQTS